MGGGYLSFYLISFYFVSFYVRRLAEDSARSRQVGEGHSVETLPPVHVAHPGRQAPPPAGKRGNAGPPSQGRARDLPDSAGTTFPTRGPCWQNKHVQRLCLLSYPLTNGKTSFHGDFQKAKQPKWGLKVPGHKKKRVGVGAEMKQPKTPTPDWLYGREKPHQAPESETWGSDSTVSWGLPSSAMF